MVKRRCRAGVRNSRYKRVRPGVDIVHMGRANWNEKCTVRSPHSSQFKQSTGKPGNGRPCYCDFARHVHVSKWMRILYFICSSKLSTRIIYLCHVHVNRVRLSLTAIADRLVGLAQGSGTNHQDPHQDPHHRYDASASPLTIHPIKICNGAKLTRDYIDWS